jgi:hypothetical protein
MWPPRRTKVKIFTTEFHRRDTEFHRGSIASWAPFRDDGGATETTREARVQSKLLLQSDRIQRGYGMYKRASSTHWRFLLAAGLALGGVLPSGASLGGDVASIQADQAHMRGTMRTTAKESYSVQEIQGESGTVVREYVSAAGKVFGLAWQSPWGPDMRQLLGSYFDQYTQAAKAQTRPRYGRRPLIIEQPGFVVQVGGHPRAFVGKAYVPEMLPAGVKAEDIQ